MSSAGGNCTLPSQTILAPCVSPPQSAKDVQIHCCRQRGLTKASSVLEERRPVPGFVTIKIVINDGLQAGGAHIFLNQLRA